MADTKNEDFESVGLSQMGATFAERAAAREQMAKAMHAEDVEDKAVAAASTKARKPRAKKS